MRLRLRGRGLVFLRSLEARCMLAQERHGLVSSFPLEAIDHEVSFGHACLIRRPVPDDQARWQVQARRANKGAPGHVLNSSHGASAASRGPLDRGTISGLSFRPAASINIDYTFSETHTLTDAQTHRHTQTCSGMAT